MKQVCLSIHHSVTLKCSIKQTTLLCKVSVHHLIRLRCYLIDFLPNATHFVYASTVTIKQIVYSLCLCNTFLHSSVVNYRDKGAQSDDRPFFFDDLPLFLLMISNKNALRLLNILYLLALDPRRVLKYISNLYSG